MHCPYCNSLDSKVTDSRSAEEGIRRRRECVKCGLRFTTYERVQSTALLVGKRDGRPQEFDRDKLLISISIACAKRPIPSHEIEKLVQDIEQTLQSLGRAEIPSAIIGEMVMDRLRTMDRVAYVRWASVYRGFQDLESFEEVVNDLRQGSKIDYTSAQLSLLEDDISEKITARHRRRNK